MKESAVSAWCDGGGRPEVVRARIEHFTGQREQGVLRRALAAALILLLALAGGLAPGQRPVTSTGALVYVDDNAPGDPGPGDPAVSDPLENGTAAHPYDSIQQAINAASDGSTIIVSAGTYRENIQLRNKGLTLRSNNPYDPAVVESTVIDGKGGGPVVSFQGNEGDTTVLSGFKITHGASVRGGGISGAGTRATIEQNLITSNTASQYGGGIANCHGLIRANTITTNTVSSPIEDLELAGGGLYNCDGTIINNLIAGNLVFGADRALPIPHYGGGLAYCDGVISSNTIARNQAGDNAHYLARPGSGGGLYHCQGTIRNNRIEGNRTAGYGGGLVSCKQLIQGNEILSNHGEWGGGGLLNCDGLIRNNLIAKNVSGEDGGGLMNCDGIIHGNIIRDSYAFRGGGSGMRNCNGVIVNNLIVNNHIYFEGGSGLDGCTGLIVNNTIAYNTGDHPGSPGVHRCGKVVNCILWGNTSDGVPRQASLIASMTYCCIQGWTPEMGGAGNIASNPRFVNAPAGNFTLQASSPCIDRGINAGLPPDIADLDHDGNTSEPWPIDLAGVARVLDGNGNGRAYVDMGAYEFAPVRNAVPGWHYYP